MHNLYEDDNNNELTTLREGGGKKAIQNHFSNLKLKYLFNGKLYF